jgi:hypothetical protein
MNAIVRPATVVIAILSWIALSNHCAFAAIAPKADTSQSECPFHSKPVTPKAPAGATQCCKILRGITPSPAKIPGCAIVDLPHVDLVFAELIVPSPAKVRFDGGFLDTGPPGTTSFVELIGSVRAHAPPLVAWV